MLISDLSSDVCSSDLVAVVFGFFDAPAQRVVGHFHDRAIIVANLHQTLFGVVAHALDTTPGAALFHHAAEAVIAVALVLIGQQTVMSDPSGAQAIEPVGGRIIGDAFTLALKVVLAGANAPGGVVVQA